MDVSALASLARRVAAAARPRAHADARAAARLGGAAARGDLAERLEAADLRAPAAAGLRAGHRRDLRTTSLAWRLALPTAALWLAAAANADRFTPRLRQQASVRELAAVLRAHPDAPGAELFTAEVRAHGFAFYMDQIVSTTRRDADFVLATDAQDDARLLRSAEVAARHFAHGPAAFGIVRRARFARSFDSEHWESLASSGDFLLVRNRPATRLVWHATCLN